MLCLNFVEWDSLLGSFVGFKNGFPAETAVVSVNADISKNNFKDFIFDVLLNFGYFF